MGPQFIPGWLIASLFSIQATLIAALAVGLMNARERIARLEEWHRLRDLDDEL